MDIYGEKEWRGEGEGDRFPPLPPRWEGRPPGYVRRAEPREAEAAAKEGGERYRRAHLRRLGAIAGAAWTIAGLMLLGFVIGLATGFFSALMGTF